MMLNVCEAQKAVWSTTAHYICIDHYQCIVTASSSSSSSSTERTPLLGTRRRQLSHIECRMIGMGILFLTGFTIGAHLLLAQYRTSHINFPFTLVEKDVWDTRIMPANMAGNIDGDVVIGRVDQILIFATGASCYNMDTCIEQMRSLKNDTLKANLLEIPYNFVIGGNGQTFEAKSWTISGYDQLMNSTLGSTFAIAFLGDFTTLPPTEQQINEAKALLSHSVRYKHFYRTFKVFGIQNETIMSNKGDQLFNTLSHWCRWTSIISVK